MQNLMQKDSITNYKISVKIVNTNRNSQSFFRYFFIVALLLLNFLAIYEILYFLSLPS